MKICVFGAGAVGCLLAAGLAESGEDVVVTARGPHLAALRERGLVVRKKGAERIVPLQAAPAGELGRQDVVILTLKAHGIAPAGDEIAALIGPGTIVVAAQNGLPWWYFHKEGGGFDGSTIESVDPGGRLWRTLPPERILGCVIYIGAEVIAPGIVEHSSGGRFVLGEPDGSASERLSRVAALIGDAGFVAETTPRIRDAIWMKLWGNITANPVSVLTGATMDRMLADAAVRRLCAGLMEETRQVGERLGIRFEGSIEQRLAAAATLGAFRTSMLQDFAAGRPLEIDAIVGAVGELGRRLSVATPLVDAVYALTRLRGVTPANAS